MPGYQQKAFLQEKLKSRGQNHEGTTLQFLPLGSWQQYQAEGAWAQVVVELSYLPAPVPGSYLWVVHLQHLGSKPDIFTLSQGTHCSLLDRQQHSSSGSQEMLCSNPQCEARIYTVEFLVHPSIPRLSSQLEMDSCCPFLQMDIPGPWVRGTKSLRRAIAWPLLLSISVTWESHSLALISISHLLNVGHETRAGFPNLSHSPPIFTLLLDIP